MQARAEDFAGVLRGGLASVYLISGDETLLVEEACDAVIARAREEGFTERSVLHVDTGFKWHDLYQEASTPWDWATRTWPAAPTAPWRPTLKSGRPASSRGSGLGTKSNTG